MRYLTILWLFVANFAFAQSITYTIDVKIEGVEMKELAAIRQLYRIPIGQRTDNAHTETISDPLFKINTTTGELNLLIYKEVITSPTILGEAYDRETGTHKYWYTYGQCDTLPEYEVFLFERLGDTYIKVSHCGENILVMGNQFLEKIFAPWRPKQIRLQ